MIFSSFSFSEDALKRDIISRLWFSYRKGFVQIGDSGLTSDKGWGCMLRCGQMLLSQALLYLHLGMLCTRTQDTEFSCMLRILFSCIFFSRAAAPKWRHGVINLKVNTLAHISSRCCRKRLGLDPSSAGPKIYTNCLNVWRSKKLSVFCSSDCTDGCRWREGRWWLVRTEHSSSSFEVRNFFFSFLVLWSCSLSIQVGNSNWRWETGSAQSPWILAHSNSWTQILLCKRTVLLNMLRAHWAHKFVLRVQFH